MEARPNIGNRLPSQDVIRLEIARTQRRLRMQMTALVWLELGLLLAVCGTAFFVS